MILKTEPSEDGRPTQSQPPSDSRSQGEIAKLRCMSQMINSHVRSIYNDAFGNVVRVSDICSYCSKHYQFTDEELLEMSHRVWEYINQEYNTASVVEWPTQCFHSRSDDLVIDLGPRPNPQPPSGTRPGDSENAEIPNTDAYPCEGCQEENLQALSFVRDLQDQDAMLRQGFHLNQ